MLPTQLRQEPRKIRVGHIAAWQRRVLRPRTGHVRQKRGKLFQCVLGELAIGSDFAAENREHRRRASGRVYVEDIVAGDRARIGRLVVIERTDA